MVMNACLVGHQKSVNIPHYLNKGQNTQEFQEMP
jgi:hypothetical protein